MDGRGSEYAHGCAPERPRHTRPGAAPSEASHAFPKDLEGKRKTPAPQRAPASSPSKLVRLASAAARLQRGDRRQGLAFQELEEGTATGGDVADLLLDAVLVDSGQGVAATGDGERLGLGD